MRPPGRFLAAGLFVLLTACAGNDGPPPPCPEIFLVPDARELVRFRGEGRDLTDVEFEARLGIAGSRCFYVEDEIESEIDVRLLAAQGPADRDSSASFEYFVAVATREPRILARESFGVTTPFEGNRTRVALIDTITPRIPLGTDEDGRNYQIYLGLVLSREELSYNRANR